MLKDKLESAANIAIVVGSIAVVYSVIKPTAAPSQPVTATSAVGMSVTAVARGVELPADGPLLLLVARSTCHFCTESVPFYRRLVTDRGRISMVAVVLEDQATGVEYFRKHGVAVDAVVSATSAQLPTVRGTPTLLLSDKSGRVVNSWIGKLSEQEESEVLSAVQSLDSPR